MRDAEAGRVGAIKGSKLRCETAYLFKLLGNVPSVPRFPTNWRDPSGRGIIEDALIISNRSLGAKEYLNALGCFSNVLLVATADELNAWTKAGVAGATYGCVSSFIWPGGDAWLSIKTTADVGLCGFGLIQVANDFSQELQGQNVTNKTYVVDALNGVLQCAVTQLGKILAGEH